MPTVAESDGIGDPIGGGTEENLTVFKQRLGVLVEHADPSLAEREKGDHCQRDQGHGDRDRCKSTLRQLDQAGDTVAEQLGQTKKATDDDRCADEICEQKPAVFDL